MAEKTDSNPNPTAHATAQPGQQQVRLRLDEAGMTTTYSNAFRTNTSAEEVFVDFGMNLMMPAAQGGEGSQNVGEMIFKLNNRVVLNYYTAKRLAMVLGQIVSRHEQQFGELKLNVNERRTG
ncbi:MAG: DUF3467 domain-containing protein [Phycisphaeraceae bacterium]|nr:DUF3467 domain-containing protein [Phycisphaeraceae bacterium]